MTYTYRITTLLGAIGTSRNPPPFLDVLFAGAVPLVVELSESECVVTFDAPQTPVDLGPLVRVELIPNP